MGTMNYLPGPAASVNITGVKFFTGDETCDTVGGNCYTAKATYEQTDRRTWTDGNMPLHHKAPGGGGLIVIPYALYYFYVVNIIHCNFHQERDQLIEQDTTIPRTYH